LLDFVRPEGASLALWSLDAGAEPIFVHGGRWLHPLFALEAFLAGRPDLDRSRLVLRDRVIGRGAGFLIVRMGIGNAGAALVSRRALELFEARGLPLGAEVLVDRIDCQTEDLLAEVTDPEAAWALLEERRRRALAPKA